ncbi:MAG: class IV adenylate cyclase [Bacilli bacterium]|nr:class IV adenylate cyclase [Bacilli bacterium]
MSIKVETESKYYCIEPEKLIARCETLGLKRIKTTVEEDEYFTDLNSMFIKNRTCLRIRKNNNNKMEITFKGKSLKLLGLYSKIENNIKADIEQYENYVALFSSLGFYSYVKVEKERLVYNYNHEKYECNIMIDKLSSIGCFVEFEIIAAENDYDKKSITSELNKFVKMFDSVELSEATEPYRDIVASHIFKTKVKSKEKKIYLNIDSIAVDLEKDFYKKHNSDLKKQIDSKIKWGSYRKNESKELEAIITDYFANKMFDTTELLALFKLLKEIDYPIFYITKANKVFFKGLLNRIGLKTTTNIYEQQEIRKDELKNSIVLDSSLKNSIQIVLIMINMEV